jgi:restriction system protein
MAKSAGPRFVTYFGPVLDALRALGSSAKPREVFDWIAEHQNVSKAELEAVNTNGLSKYENKVSWAKFYLAKAGMIDTQKRGIWILTEQGRNAILDQQNAVELYKRVRQQFRAEIEAEEGDKRNASEETVGDEVSAPGDQTYFNEDDVRKQLIILLKGFSDRGFEEFCALFLRQTGFENVTVLGRTGDEGVDGEGYLLINRFVRTKVMFQCKRYDGTISPDKIRDFRGAIQGRAERGIFITTGTFTRGAIQAAGRENATPIELVDIDRLIDLLIEQRIGVNETKALKIDHELFGRYKSPKFTPPTPA